ncbi:MAG: GNAT family N-acetyltransferase [Clostridia bacterium]|nr:GNAT family N-acetyltransferase [Clostridia bacterium]
MKVTVEQINRQCEEELIVRCYDPSEEWVLRDLRVTPPGIGERRKHYVGFYREQELIAVMDLIDGYPREDTAFIGFFMVSSSVQRHVIGSGIIGDTAAYLKKIGKAAIQLGIDQGNPQSTALWK